MNLLLISGLAIILGVGAVLGLRRWRGDSADDYVSLAMTLLGTFGGFTLGMLASEVANQGEVAAHVQGILRSAEVSTRNALESVETRIEFADFARNNPGEGLEAVPLGFHLPRTLGTLQQDGTLFMALSPLLRENLDSLTGNLEILERGYVYGVQEAPRSHALGVLEMIRSELQAHMAVIEAELEWQEGQIDGYEHQQRFRAALHSRDVALLERDEKLGSR